MICVIVEIVIFYSIVDAVERRLQIVPCAVNAVSGHLGVKLDKIIVLKSHFDHRAEKLVHVLIIKLNFESHTVEFYAAYLGALVDVIILEAIKYLPGLCAYL